MSYPPAEVKSKTRRQHTRSGVKTGSSVENILGGVKFPKLKSELASFSELQKDGYSMMPGLMGPMGMS